MAKQLKERYVMVTTAHRGVFAGYATATDGETIRLRRAHMVDQCVTIGYPEPVVLSPVPAPRRRTTATVKDNG